MNRAPLSALGETGRGASSNQPILFQGAKILNLRSWVLPVALLSSLLAPRLAAQGKQEDYERAQQFLPGNLRHLLYVADVNPHWIQKTNRFWYRKSSPSGNEFILVDSEQNTTAPAFDHARLAAALSHANKQEYSPSDLPFRDLSSWMTASQSASQSTARSGRVPWPATSARAILRTETLE